MGYSPETGEDFYCGGGKKGRRKENGERCWPESHGDGSKRSRALEWSGKGGNQDRKMTQLSDSEGTKTLAVGTQHRKECQQNRKGTRPLIRGELMSFQQGKSKYSCCLK